MSRTEQPEDLNFDPKDPDTIFDPHAIFRRMREEAPLYYNDHYGFYAVSRFDDAEHVLLERETFISGHGVTLDLLKSGQPIPPGTLIFDEPPRHGIHRNLLSRMFTRRRISDVEPLVRQLCADLLDPFVGAGGFDMVADLGSIVPMRVISLLLGIPEEDGASVRDHFNAQRANAERDNSVLEGAMFADYIDYRVENPSDDLMTHLLQAEFEDENGKVRRLARDELLAYVNIVAAAGNETTKTLIGWTGKLLGDHPDQRKLLVEDPGRIPNAIEEILRYEPNTLTNGRYVAKETELYGKAIPEGSIMLTLTPSANRDHRHFADPDRFDVLRHIDHHLSFGFGAHYCLGQALARLEGRVVLEEVLKRFPEWDVDLERAEFMSYTDMRGYDKLPLVVP